MMNIKDIHVGDSILANPSGLPSRDRENSELPFEVLMVYEEEQYPEDSWVIIRTDNGWPTLDNDTNIRILPGYPQEHNDQILALQKTDTRAWRTFMEDIKSVIPASHHKNCQSAKDGVYNPLTSTVKSKEELEQFKKDFEFFFSDLTVPHKPPSGAWAKYS